MNFYKELASYSTAPKDKDEATPQQSTDVVPKGGVSSWIGLGWEAGGAIDALKKAGKTGDFGYFPIPGKTADKPGSVFLGGSNLAIAERSQNKELAKEWLALAAGKEYMTKYAPPPPRARCFRTPTPRSSSRPPAPSPRPWPPPPSPARSPR